MAENLGQVIRSVAKQKGITQQALAEMVNMTKSAIAAIYRRSTIDVGLLMLLSKVLNHDFFAELYEHPYLVNFKEAREEDKTNKIAELEAKVKYQNEIMAMKDEMLHIQNLLIQELQQKKENSINPIKKHS